MRVEHTPPAGAARAEDKPDDDQADVKAARREKALNRKYQIYCTRTPDDERITLEQFRAAQVDGPAVSGAMVASDDEDEATPHDPEVVRAHRRLDEQDAKLDKILEAISRIEGRHGGDHDGRRTENADVHGIPGKKIAMYRPGRSGVAETMTDKDFAHRMMRIRHERLLDVPVDGGDTADQSCYSSDNGEASHSKRETANRKYRDDVADISRRVHRPQLDHDEPTLRPARLTERWPKDVPTFSGKAGPFEQWLAKYNILTENCDWTEEEKAKNAMIFMTGVALDRFCDLPEEIRTNWRRLTKTMTSFFPRVPKTTSTYRAEFKSITQSRDETVTDVAAKIETAAPLAFPETTSRGIEVEKQEQFTLALWSNKIRDALVARKFISFGEMLEEAVRLDGYYRDRARLKDGSAKQQYIRNAQESESELSDGPTTTRRQRRRKRSSRDAKNAKQLNGDHCSASKGDENLVSQMTEAFRQAMQQQPRWTPAGPDRMPGRPAGNNGYIRRAHPRQDLATVQCFNCKRFGHFRRDCRNEFQSLPQQGLPPGQQPHATANHQWQDNWTPGQPNHGAARQVRAPDEVIASGDQYNTTQRLMEAGDVLYALGGGQNNGIPDNRPRVLRDVELMRKYGTIPEADAPTRACIIPIAVNEQPIAAFLDTGATMTVISEAFAQTLEKAGKLQRYPSAMRARLFGDKQAVSFHHAAMVDISIGQMKLRQEVQILENLSYDCFLGDNFFRQCQLVIDYYNRVVVAGGLAIPFMRRGQVIAMLASLVGVSGGQQ
jgi:hypothetical protein